MVTVRSGNVSDGITAPVARECFLVDGKWVSFTYTPFALHGPVSQWHYQVSGGSVSGGPGRRVGVTVPTGDMWVFAA